MGDDATSGEKIPLGRILYDFWLRMRTPKGIPSGSRYLWSLRVTFHNVTSGQKAPLGRILCNFRLHVRTHKRTSSGHLRGPLSGSRDHFDPVAMVLVLLYYILYYYYSSTQYTGCACARDHFRFLRRASSGHVTDVTSGSTTAQHHHKLDFVRPHILLPHMN